MKGILEPRMPSKPFSVLHESSTPGYQDILDIRQRFELGAADENWRFFPHPVVLQELGHMGARIGWSRGGAVSYRIDSHREHPRYLLAPTPNAAATATWEQ